MILNLLLLANSIQDGEQLPMTGLLKEQHTGVKPFPFKLLMCIFKIFSKIMGLIIGARKEEE